MSAHRPAEDIFAGFSGIAVFSLGLTMLLSAGLVTGGLPGLALLLRYATGLPVWLLILLVGIPFYGLSLWRMGWKLTLRTIVAVAVLSAVTRFTPDLIGFGRLDPIYAAAISGVLMGLGLLILFRHRTSLGGFGILALYLQERFGWRAGYVQMTLDVVILAVALFVVEPYRVGLSLVSAVMLNLVIAVNHKPGRYVGLS